MDMISIGQRLCKGERETGRIMKCLYCNEEMENGYLKSNHTIRWGKDIEMGLITDDIRVNNYQI